jgi:opacity protein-like surface antigen
MSQKLRISTLLIPLLISTSISADESLLGRVKGSETLPKGVFEFDQALTYRTDKGTGHYEALNSKTELEYGVTNKLTASGYIKMQGIDTSGLWVDGYLPGPEKYSLKPSGVEGSLKYNFLSPALDDFGLSGYVSLGYDWLDMHSGKDKDKTTLELQLLAQKYFMDGQLIWMGNAGLETTYAKRAAIANLPDGFEWSTDPEVEIGLMAGTGVSYRFTENWFIGAEVIYETEFETEVGQERYSWQAGPSLHYGGQNFWTTLSWLPQIYGGGEQFATQDDMDLHLIEKTKQEYTLKFGIDF